MDLEILRERNSTLMYIDEILFTICGIFKLKPRVTFVIKSYYCFV